MEILHSKIYGQDKPGTPLLVFHGLFGMLDNWGSFGKEMGEFLDCQIKEQVQKTFIVHGEFEAQQAYKNYLQNEGFSEIEIPEKGQWFAL